MAESGVAGLGSTGIGARDVVEVSTQGRVRTLAPGARVRK